MSENRNQWLEVPANSICYLSVRGKTNSDVNFVVGATVIPTLPEEPYHIRDFQLNPGPETVVIQEDTGYSIFIHPRFLSPDTETAVVRAHVEDPQGNKLPDWDGELEYKYEVSGKAGEPNPIVNLIIIEEF